jgi:hypothetical protein
MKIFMRSTFLPLTTLTSGKSIILGHILFDLTALGFAFYSLKGTLLGLLSLQV